MEETDDSTTDTGGYTEEDRQGIVDTLVTVMLQLIMEDPWMSIPNMMDRMIETGPMSEREDKLELFRGRPIFWRVARRLEIVRAAAAGGIHAQDPFL